MTSTTPTYPDVRVSLLGTDGNVFAVIGVVASALRRRVSTEAANGFAGEAMRQNSYDAVLQLAMRTVIIE